MRIAISGMDGSGKSTLSRLLQQTLGGNVIDEPFENNPFLVRSRTGEKSFVYETQLWFMLERAKHRLESTDRGLTIFDRCLEEGIEVYGQFFVGQRLLTFQENACLQTLLNSIKVEVPPLDKIIYMHVSPEILLKRIRDRGRGFEQTITLEQISEKQAIYDRWYEAQTCAKIQVNETDYDRATGMISERLLDFLSPLPREIEMPLPLVAAIS